MQELGLSDKDGEPFAQLRYWLVQVANEGRLPTGYLVVLSVVVGYRRANEVENADLAEQAKQWKLLASDGQTGEFDGVQLFHLMKEAEMGHNG